MEWKQYSAKTVDDALLEAAIDLGTTRDKVEYEVVFQGSNGFLGIGSKKAIINRQLRIRLGNLSKNLDEKNQYNLETYLTALLALNKKEQLNREKIEKLNHHKKNLIKLIQQKQELPKRKVHIPIKQQSGT
jgi:spoIIIJ-associated protein